jgi:DNA-binding transcriptional regulator YhcF (GntR family)
VTFVAIDPESPVPAFEQLRVQLSGLIRTGVLAPGAKLPTVRQLAGDLELAKNTVVRAYRALEQEGLVRGDRRLGTSVIEARRPNAAHRADLVAAATRRYLAELAQLGVGATDAIEAVRRQII